MVARVLLVVGCLLFRRDHFSLHVAEGASDKTDAFTLRVRVTALAAENPNHDTSSAPFTDFTHSGFSLFSVWCWTICFPSDPNNLNLLSSLKWTLAQFSSLHTTCSSAKVSIAFWFFLLIWGLATAECAFSLISLKRTVQCWTGEQFQLQCWTDSPLRLCVIQSSRAFVLHGQPAFWETWMKYGYCKPAINLQQTFLLCKALWITIVYEMCYINKLALPCLA